MQENGAWPGLGRCCSVHPPETAGENFKWAVLAVGDDLVVFWVVVGDDVTVGEEVIIQGPASET